MAVYTEVSDDQLAALLAGYDIGAPVSFKGIAEGIENSNYFLQTTTGRYILTLFEKRVDPAGLPFFMGLMDHLSARGIPCPVPLKGNGAWVNEVAGRPCAIVTFLEGLSPRRPRRDHCTALGGALAALHLASANFAAQRPNDFSLETWRALFAATEAETQKTWPALTETVAAELDFLESAWPEDLPAGVIHGDLFPDNVMFTGLAVSGIIDFYFACTDLYAYEIAICLNAWCFEPDGDFNVTKARGLLTAYRAVRPFTEAEMAALPLLARGASLRFLLTRLQDWFHGADGALGRKKDPLEYWHKLRFHQAAKSAADYGITK
ncbi:MAG: homoserine kinase [Magnetospiraceae bacterium]